MKKLITVAIVLLLSVGLCLAQTKENDKVISYDEAMKQAWGNETKQSVQDYWRKTGGDREIQSYWNGQRFSCVEKFLYKDNFGRNVYAGSCKNDTHYYRTDGRKPLFVD